MVVYGCLSSMSVFCRILYYPIRDSCFPAILNKCEDLCPFCGVCLVFQDLAVVPLGALVSDKYGLRLVLVLQCFLCLLLSRFGCGGSFSVVPMSYLKQCSCVWFVEIRMWVFVPTSYLKQCVCVRVSLFCVFGLCIVSMLCVVRVVWVM